MLCPDLAHLPLIWYVEPDHTAGFCWWVDA